VGRIACHAGCLAIVFSSVSDLRKLLPESPWTIGLALIAGYSGMGNGYGFYAPRPGLPRRIVVRLYRPATQDWISETIDWGRGEAMLHVETMYHHFQEGDFLREYAASWAAWYFGRHPDAAVAVVEDQVWNLPSLRASRQRPRVQWVTMTLYSFARTDQPIAPEPEALLPDAAP